MKKIDHAISELKEMDALAAESSPVHDLHPAVKLIGGGSVAAVGETDEILSNKELLEQNRLEVPIGLMK